MQCPKCQFENRDVRKFCAECGAKFVLTCPKCGFENLPTEKFCGDCGHNLKSSSLPPPEIESSRKTIPEEPTTQTYSPDISAGARKQVTVLFSDLSGYTAMTEKLDPEEVKEIMEKVFGEISKVVAKYEGFIENFIIDIRSPG